MNPVDQAVSPRRGGRPLDRDRDAAIRMAALQGLAELGYDRLSMEEIASRAKAGKGALYRRWPSKAALVVDAIVAWREEVVPVVIPDTGTLMGDLEALVAALPDFDATVQQQMSVLLGLLTAAGRDPELQQALSDGILERPRRVLQEVLQRGVARGEIAPERDLSLVPDILIGLNLMRIVLGDMPDRDYVRRVILGVIHPLVTAPLVPPTPRRRSRASVR
jgi:AcrR family transcriptional regulator